jgi:hypothetical protein
MVVAPTHVPPSLTGKYEIIEWKHASSVIKLDFPNEWEDLIDVLDSFKLKRSDILKPGGRKSPIALSINGSFDRKGWVEKKFDIQVTVDGVAHSTPTHSVDYYKNRIAIETEWNNKDPFYDRDLNNFRLLHQLDVISAGVIITRADELQEIFDDLGRGASFGASTTHLSKLIPRLEGGGAGGCPVLVFAIKKALYIED